MTYPRAPRAALALARSRSVLATSTVMALTTGGLFFVSGSLAFVLATQMPEGPGNVVVVYGLAGGAVLIGVGLAIGGRQLRPECHHLLVVGGIVMLAGAILEATSAVAADALASLAPAWTHTRSNARKAVGC